MKENQIFTCAGDLMTEMQEMTKVYNVMEEEKVITLTFDCTGFLTLVCC